MKILVSDKLSKSGLAVLDKNQKIEYQVKSGLSPSNLKKIINDYHGIIIRSNTILDYYILENAHNLKVIGRAGVGIDNIDVEYATKKGILVLNTPGANTISTCELTIALLLSMSRKIPQANFSLKNNEWNQGKFHGTEVYGKTLGIVGFGRIGREVAKRMIAFGMKPVIYDPLIKNQNKFNLNVEFVKFDELCKRSDFITLHIPKNATTKYLFNRTTFKLLKRGVQIVNCARGGIINEVDLFEALESGIIAAVALDVFEIEPPYNNPLLSLDNVIAIPHLGAATYEAKENVGFTIASQVCDALEGIEIRNCVNC